MERSSDQDVHDPGATLQILSDLHLETPATRPSYSEFSFEKTSLYIALLGDIGLVNDSRLFSFLNVQLHRYKIVLYVLGNHEPYDSQVHIAKDTLKAFESEVALKAHQDDRLGKFVFLDQTRYDLTPSITILGCTLYSAISPDQASSARLFITDFERIHEWNIDAHNAAHASDLVWLNDQVNNITSHEANRRIVILTHSSPTIQAEANDSRHLKDNSGVRTAFMTDLSREPCWTSPAVVLWAFGHTHFNCDFVDPRIGKRVLANQKGYRRSEAEGFDPGKVVGVGAASTANIAGSLDRVEECEEQCSPMETDIEQNGHATPDRHKVGRLLQFFRRHQ